jgi:hypothetical protein
VAEGVDFSGSIVKFSPTGERTTFQSDVWQIRALAFDRSGDLFAGQSFNGIADIFRLRGDGTGLEQFAHLESATELWGMAFDGAGNLFVSTGDRIVKVSPNRVQSTFASGLEEARPLAFDKFGNLCRN